MLLVGVRCFGFAWDAVGVAGTLWGLDGRCGGV